MEAIFEAAKRGKVRDIERLVSEDRSMVFARDDEGNTPLHIAATHRKCRAARVLIQNGAEVNVANDQGLFPLDMVNDGKYRFIDLRDGIYSVLLENGARLAKPQITAERAALIRTAHRVIRVFNLILATALLTYAIMSGHDWMRESSPSILMIAGVVLFPLELVERWLLEKIMPYGNM